MTLKKMITAFVGVGLVLALTACTTLPEPTGTPPATDFWGNPVPSDDPEATCEITPPAPPPPYNPADDTRPPDIKPGYSWMTYELQVQALSNDGALTELCVPVNAHAYSLSGEPDTLTLNRLNLPATAISWLDVTPLHGHFLALEYDPTEERFAGRPPAYEVHISATYIGEPRPPFTLVCTIRVAGAALRREYAVIGTEDGFSTVSCTLTGNVGWRPY